MTAGKTVSAVGLPTQPPPIARLRIIKNGWLNGQVSDPPKSVVNVKYF